MRRLSRKWLKSIRKKLRKSSHSRDNIVYSSYTVPCPNEEELIIYEQQPQAQAAPQVDQDDDDEQLLDQLVEPGDQRFKYWKQDDDAIILAATIKIQATFRGHLGRRAYKALRSLVKLQALARGAYVRKQTQLALHCMHALVRLQVRVRARQLLGSFDAS